MTQTLTLVGALLVVLLLNAAMVLYFARSGGVDPGDAVGESGPGETAVAGAADATRPPDEPAPPLEADGPTVDCGHCGTENVADYRFCRWCVAPLGDGDARERAGAAVSGRAF